MPHFQGLKKLQTFGPRHCLCIIITNLSIFEQPMKCPKCDIFLVISDRQGIEIDYCPQCRGVWLDRGELDKIIERSSAYETRDKKDHEDDRHEFKHREGHDDRYFGDRNKPYKKKSLLGDLFDFD
jgi:uncharacterized protein